MSKKICYKYIADIRDSVDIMEKNISNIDILKFYTGKTMLLCKEFLSLLVKA